MGGATRANTAGAFVDTFGDLDVSSIGLTPRSLWVVEANELVMSDMEEVVVRMTIRKLGGPRTRTFDTPLGLDLNAFDGITDAERAGLMDEWAHTIADLFDLPVAEARQRLDLWVGEDS